MKRLPRQAAVAFRLKADRSGLLVRSG